MVKGQYSIDSIPQSFIDAVKSAIERDKEEETVTETFTIHKNGIEVPVTRTRKK